MSFVTAYYDAGFGKDPYREAKINKMIHIDSHWDQDDGEHYGGGYGFKSEDRDKTCKYCGKAGLEWLSTPEGWRLGSYSTIHDCPNRPIVKFDKSLLKPKPVTSSKVFDLLSDAIQGNHFSTTDSKEYGKLMRYFKDNGLTVDQLLKG